MQAQTTTRNSLALRGLKPAAELSGGRQHGTRMCYMAGCRCDACRAANAASERRRAAARKAGESNGLVSAEAARRHMLALAAAGVGRRAIHLATDVSDSILGEIRTGKRQRIRAATERRILAVTAAAAMGGAMITAADTWSRVAELIKNGYTRQRIAAEIGQHGNGLQLGRHQVTVRNATLVRNLHQRVMAEHAGERRCVRCKEWWPEDSEFFYRRSKGPDGLDSTCKACRAEGRTPRNVGRLTPPNAE